MTQITTPRAFNMTRRLTQVLWSTPRAMAAVLSLVMIGAQPVGSSGPARQSAAPAAAVATSAHDESELLHEVTEPQTPEAPAPAAIKRHVIQMEVTAYCACTQCCGPNAAGVTASGRLVSYNNSQFVAADTRVLPFGQKLIIPGYADNQPVEVIDRGGAIKGNKLDLFFPTHEAALQWGRQHLDVVVID